MTGSDITHADLQSICLLFLTCVIPTVQYVTVGQPVKTQQFVIVIYKGTCFGCTRQPSPGFTFQKCIKRKLTAVAVQTTVNTYG